VTQPATRLDAVLIAGRVLVSRMLLSRRRGAAALLGLLIAVACGNLKKVEVPTELPNPAATIPPPPSPGVTPTPAPIATPTPSATATPTPNPTATPGPTPAPTPTPAGSSCRLPAMPECGGPEGPAGVYGCCRNEGTRIFEAQVDLAIAVVQREQPQLFSGNRVLDANAYVRGVAQVLEQRLSLCAKQGGPEDEVAVKSSNSFSEQYDILFGNGTVRNQGYAVTCRPARF
jgi:hypothetical protein